MCAFPHPNWLKQNAKWNYQLHIKSFIQQQDMMNIYKMYALPTYNNKRILNGDFPYKNISKA